MTDTVRISLNRQFGVRQRDGSTKYYGPGEDVEVPASLAEGIGRKQETAARMAAARERRAQPPGRRATAETEGLDAVGFASAEARSRADELGLTAEDFARRRRSSERGFVLDDVDRIAAEVGKAPKE